VCVVDEDFARFYFPDSTAIGQRLFEGSEQGKDADAFTIVGVVGRVKQAELTDDEPQGAVYYPYRFRGDNSVFVVVRTAMPPESLGQTVQRVVRQIDPDLPVNDLRSMDSLISESLTARRSPALLAMLFSAIAVLLTAIGTYGVLSYAVAQRRREIGVRMALGARPGQIRSQFFFLAVRLLGSGMILGIIGAWLVGQTMRTILFHVPAFSVAMLGGAAGVMGVVCLAACILPSQRAASTSPMQALAE
jgi:ABC-type antimicrobial peptide transport system permease subunit